MTPPGRLSRLSLWAWPVVLAVVVVASAAERPEVTALLAVLCAGLAANDHGARRRARRRRAAAIAVGGGYWRGTVPVAHDGGLWQRGLTPETWIPVEVTAVAGGLTFVPRRPSRPPQTLRWDQLTGAREDDHGWRSALGGPAFTWHTRVEVDVVARPRLHFVTDDAEGLVDAVTRRVVSRR
jgi:hypothetical protein